MFFIFFSFALSFNEPLLHTFSRCFRSWPTFLNVQIDQCSTFLHFWDGFLNKSFFFFLFTILSILLSMNDGFFKFSFCLILLLSFYLISSKFGLIKFLNCCFVKFLTFSKFLQKQFFVIWFFNKNLFVSRAVNLFFFQHGRLKFGLFLKICSFDFIFAERCEALIKFIVFF